MSIKTILVIDDSPTERHMVSTFLLKQGYQVALAEDGKDGVAKARQLHPDLILMDVVMPGINGFQATRMLSRDEETRSIPVIMCTSKNQETDIIWGIRQGARDYLTKPVRTDLLLNKIKALS